MGQNETYSQPRSQILTITPVPSVNKACSIIISEESQRSMGEFTQVVDISDGVGIIQ